MVIPFRSLPRSVDLVIIEFMVHVLALLNGVSRFGKYQKPVFGVVMYSLLQITFHAPLLETSLVGIELDLMTALN